MKHPAYKTCNKLSSQKMITIFTIILPYNNITIYKGGFITVLDTGIEGYSLPDSFPDILPIKVGAEY